MQWVVDLQTDAVQGFHHPDRPTLVI